MTKIVPKTIMTFELFQEFRFVGRIIKPIFALNAIFFEIADIFHEIFQKLILVPLNTRSYGTLPFENLGKRRNAKL